jgi:hypothetical protein
MNLRSTQGGPVGWKLGTVLVGVTAGLVVAAPFAFADDADGGHCSYGDFSVNVAPSCDTSNGGDAPRDLPPFSDELRPTVPDLRPTL